MVNLEQIQNLILVADAYALEAGQALYTEQTKGCVDCCDASVIERLEWLTDSLNKQVSNNDYGTTTQMLYNCLLSAVGNYSGASLSVDPNASVPNTNIIIDGGVVDNRPYEIDIFYNDMSGDNGSGGRTTYTNPSWIGFYPLMQTSGVVQLFQYKDYTYDVATGTFTLLPNAESGVTGIYEGGVIRVTGFNKTGDTPPQPPTGDYSLINNSLVDAEYLLDGDSNVVIAGQSITNDFEVGQQITANVLEEQTCTYNVYDENGDLDFTFTQEGLGTINGLPMEAGKSYEFIWIDNETPPQNLWIDTNTWNDNNTWID